MNNQHKIAVWQSYTYLKCSHLYFLSFFFFCLIICLAYSVDPFISIFITFIMGWRFLAGLYSTSLSFAVWQIISRACFPSWERPINFATVWQEVASFGQDCSFRVVCHWFPRESVDGLLQPISTTGKTAQILQVLLMVGQPYFWCKSEQFYTGISGKSVSKLGYWVVFLQYILLRSFIMLIVNHLHAKDIKRKFTGFRIGRNACYI